MGTRIAQTRARANASDTGCSSDSKSGHGRDAALEGPRPYSLNYGDVHPDGWQRVGPLQRVQKVNGLRESADVPDWSASDLQPAADRVDPKRVVIYDALERVLYFSNDGVPS